MSDWIPVEDRTPDLKLSLSNGFSYESDRVLVGGKEYGVSIACLYSDGYDRAWWWTERHGEELEGITHWMPLPDVPK